MGRGVAGDWLVWIYCNDDIFGCTRDWFHLRVDEGCARVGLICDFELYGENQNLLRQLQLSALVVISALHFLVIFDFETKLFV